MMAERSWAGARTLRWGGSLAILLLMSLALFADHPSEPFSLYLDRFELSP